MDRAVASDLLRREGFYAFERRWSLGDTIGVGAKPSHHGGIVTWGVMMYLYPVENGDWNIANLREMKTPDVGCRLPLRAAVALVIELMRHAAADAE